jgi:ammonia channel protein AmtB
MLVASAFVFLMMPGFALFYGGLDGQKNVISSMAQSHVAIGGVIGVALTGPFASLVVNTAGGWAQFGRESLPAAMGLVYPFVMTFAILWITEKIAGLRVSPNEQAPVLDESNIGEKACVP